MFPWVIFCAATIVFHVLSISATRVKLAVRAGFVDHSENLDYRLHITAEPVFGG